MPNNNDSENGWFTRKQTDLRDPPYLSFYHKCVTVTICRKT